MRCRSILFTLGLCLAVLSYGKGVKDYDVNSGYVSGTGKSSPVFMTTYAIITGQLQPLSSSMCPTITAMPVEPPVLSIRDQIAFEKDMETRFQTIIQMLQPAPMLSGNPAMGSGGVQTMAFTPNLEGILAFLFENPTMRRIHMATVSIGVGPKPKPLQTVDMPMWCDVILYFHPKAHTIVFEPFLAESPKYPLPVNLPNVDLMHEHRQLVFRIASEVTRREREIFSGLVNLYNNTVESFFMSVKSYTPTITYQIAGKQGQISVDIPWFINDYSASMHELRKHMRDKDKAFLRYMTYVILSGYRAKDKDYPKDPYEVIKTNLNYIANLKVFSVPTLPPVELIRLWQMPNTVQFYPKLNPIITSFMNQTFFIGTPRSVLDVPVLVHLILTHDFSQDTLFTRFVIAYFQQSPMPEVSEREAELLAKLGMELFPFRSEATTQEGNLKKQLDEFIEKANEFHRRVFHE